jgi:hypothetical protein
MGDINKPQVKRERLECRKIGCRRKGYWISEEGVCVPTRHEGEKHIVVITFEEIEKHKKMKEVAR